jgi:hypothetical protein
MAKAGCRLLHFPALPDLALSDPSLGQGRFVRRFLAAVHFFQRLPGGAANGIKPKHAKRMTKPIRLPPLASKAPHPICLFATKIASPAPDSPDAHGRNHVEFSNS